jgi:hypothetical protein
MLKRIKKLTNYNQGSRRASNMQATLKIKVTLIPTENQIFMDCLDAHLYEIDYKCQLWPRFRVRNSTMAAKKY